MNSVAVVGGGITGLTAAFRLQQRGIPVTLYEADSRVGGPIRTVAADGFLAECGPNTILETSPKVTSLVNDCGLATKRQFAETAAKNRYIIRDGRPIPLPLSPGAFLKSDLFSAKAKLRLVAEPFVKAPEDNGDESLASFVTRRLGTEFLDYAINPFVAGVYAGDPTRLSVREAFPKLHALEKKYGSLIKGQILGARERKKRGEVSRQAAPMFSFDTGLETLPLTLRERLGHVIRLGVRVIGAERDCSGWTLDVMDDGLREQVRHSAVVMATPAHQLALLDARFAGGGELQQFSSILYPPIASVVLGFSREDVAHSLDGFGLLVPECEPFSILGCFFSSSLFPNRAPEGFVSLTTFIGGVRAPKFVEKDPAEIIATIMPDLQILLGVSGQPVFEHVSIYKEAIPQYEIGYGQYREALNRVEHDSPGIFFAGSYRAGISVSDCIVLGDDIASRVAAHVDASRVAKPQLTTI